jgi:thiol-disulfide isomerase/thioredoxin
MQRLMRLLLGVLLGLLPLRPAQAADTVATDPAAGTPTATANPTEILKRIDDLRAARLTAARQSGGPYDAAGVERDTREIARQGTAGVDAQAIPAADALAWAKVFAVAHDNTAVIALVARFLATNPSAADRFTAELLRLDALAETNDGKQLAALLVNVVAPDDGSAGLLTAKVVRHYVDLLAAALGTDATVALLDKIHATLPAGDATALARTRLAVEEERRKKNSLPPVEDEAKQLAAYEQQVRNTWRLRGYFFAKAESDLLVAAGRHDDAVKLLAGFVDATPPEFAGARRAANSTKALLTLPGTAAPDIKPLSSIGAFGGLSALKGKVVLLDFFAHWCGPCKASIPDTHKLLADLQDQGLAVVGVTQYYGYYGKERNLSRADEEDRLHGFVKEHDITWPIVLVDGDTSASYGVSGIPEVVVLDRQGTIRKIEVGYSPDSFARFRAEVEALLKA